MAWLGLRGARVAIEALLQLRMRLLLLLLLLLQRLRGWWRCLGRLLCYHAMRGSLHTSSMRAERL